MTLREIAERLGAELIPGSAGSGFPDLEITGVAGIQDAGPSELTFIANPKYVPLAQKTRAAAILVEPEFASVPVATLRIKNPYLAFSRALQIFHPSPTYTHGIHPTAAVATTARIGARAHIGAYVVVGEDCVVGDDSVLLPHVVLYPGVTIGKRALLHAHAVVREGCSVGHDVILQNGVVVGGDGFGFAKGAEGRWNKIAQPAPVILEDEVEVQSNSCIDRASVGETRIARGAKIDNLVQVGHGSYVGENTLLCAQVGLAGSTRTGKNVILAGQVGVVGHLTIGDGAVVTAQSGIPGDVAPGAVMSGSPATESRLWMRNVSSFNRLADTLRKLKKQ